MNAQAIDEEPGHVECSAARYPVLATVPQCRLAGKPYGDPFGVDVAFGDPILGPPETVVAHDVLGFAGIAPPTLRLYPIETHIAEKLHAYTMPRARPNSRVKYLPDLALLASVKALDAARLRAAFEQTFAFRKTHELPAALPAPPPAWETPDAAMARDDRLVVGDARRCHRCRESVTRPGAGGGAVGHLGQGEVALEVAGITPRR